MLPCIVLCLGDLKWREERMEWLYPRRRGPEWKQGWTSQTLSSISAPPLHLLTIFAIVVLLLCLSQHTEHKSQMQQTAIKFQVLLMLLPIVLILLVISCSSITSGGGWFSFFKQRRLRQEMVNQGGGGSPWGVAILVVLVLVLVSYQSSFHSKWFGSLRTLD